MYITTSSLLLRRAGIDRPNVGCIGQTARANPIDNERRDKAIKSPNTTASN